MEWKMNTSCLSPHACTIITSPRWKITTRDLPLTCFELVCFSQVSPPRLNMTSAPVQEICRDGNVTAFTGLGVVHAMNL